MAAKKKRAEQLLAQLELNSFKIQSNTLCNEKYVKLDTFVADVEQMFETPANFAELLKHWKSGIKVRARQDFALQKFKHFDEVVVLSWVRALLTPECRWEVFSYLQIVPLVIREVDYGCILVATTPLDAVRQQRFKKAKMKLLQLLDFGCNHCMRSISKLMCIVDSRGSVLATTLADKKRKGWPEASAMTLQWADCVVENLQELLEVANYKAVFVRGAGTSSDPGFGFHPSSSTSSNTFGSTYLFCQPRQMFLQGPTFPTLVQKTDGTERIEMRPGIHVGIGSITHPQCRSGPLSPIAQKVYDTVYAASVNPNYLRNSIQMLRNFNKALIKTNETDQAVLDSITSKKERTTKQQWLMVGCANDWALKAGVTERSVATCAKAETGWSTSEDKNAVVVALRWENDPSSTQKSMDLDAHAYVRVPVRSSRRVGGAEYQQKYRIVCITYSNKFFCAGCRCFISKNVCEKHGIRKMGIFREDKQHEPGGSTEEMRFGSEFDLLVFFSFQLYSTTNVETVRAQFEMSVGAGVTAKRFKSDWISVKRTQNKLIFRDGGMTLNMAKALGVELSAEAQELLAGVKTTITRYSIEKVLYAGGGVQFPLDPKLFNSNLSEVNAEQLNKMQADVAAFFDGHLPRGRTVTSLSQLRMLWPPTDINATAANIRELLESANVPPKMAMLLASGRVVDVATTNISPTFAYTMTCNDVSLGDQKTPKVCFASFVHAGDRAVKAGAARDLSKAPTGLFTTNEWGNTVEMRMGIGKGTGKYVRVVGVARTNTSKVPFFIVQCAPVSRIRLPSSNGYDMVHLPITPDLLNQFRGAKNHKRLRMSAQLIGLEMEAPVNTLFGFVAMPNMPLTFCVAGTEELITDAAGLESLPSCTHFRPRGCVTGQQMAATNWDQIHKLMNDAETALGHPNHSDAFETLGDFLFENQPKISETAIPSLLKIPVYTPPSI